MNFKRLWGYLLIALVSFSLLTGCGSSSKEAKELLTRILQLVGIPYDIVVNVCQDNNKNGFCESTEPQVTLKLNKQDTVESLWQKITQTAEGQYLLETYDPTKPILVELQDVAKVNFDEGKFTLNFDGFKNKEENSVKELSILQSMVDADAISVVEANKFRTLDNSEAQEKFYKALLDNLETNINTLREKGLDSQKAVELTIKEMADETKTNQAQADRINGCGDNQTCVDEEIKKVSDELIIDENESKDIVSTQNVAPTPTPTPSGKTSKIKKTGQSKSYDSDGNEVVEGSVKDDGYYQKGTTPSYTRDDAKEVVTDNLTGLMWQDDASVASVEKPWLTQTNYDICTGENGQTQDMSKCYDSTGDTATTYCTELVIGGFEDWRLPTRKELVGIADYGRYNSAINSAFVNSASYVYWSSTTRAINSNVAWIVGFYFGEQDDNGKDDNFYVRCVRAGE